ncbi:hypothetical protein DFH28DRAFT_948161 [Melampsora americana]|nr:hypothetical protein DFH28DRAFT_948161 [Melampsora americana]
MSKTLFKSHFSPFMISIFFCLIAWIPTTHQSIIPETTDKLSKGSWTDYEDFWSLMDPILTLPETYSPGAQQSPSKDTYLGGHNIGAGKQKCNSPEIHNQQDARHFSQNLEFHSKTLPQSQIHQTIDHSAYAEDPIISIPGFFSHTPENKLAYISRDVGHEIQIHIMDYLKKELEPLEFKQANKIWNNQILLPFAYFVISHDPNSQISTRAKKLAAICFLAYHKRFLAHCTEIDYEHLAKFLAWTTDIFHQITSPKLIFNVSKEIEEEHLQVLGQARSVHPVAQAFLVLRGQNFNQKIFCAKHKNSVRFSKSFIIQWEKDMQKQKDQDKVKVVFNLWKNWNNKAEEIISHCMKIDREYPSRFGLHMNPKDFKQFTSPTSFETIETDSPTQVSDSARKMGYGFSYLMNLFMQTHQSIWNVNKSDSTCKILYKFLNQNREENESKQFWNSFLEWRQMCKELSEKGRIYRVNKNKKRKQLDEKS